MNKKQITQTAIIIALFGGVGYLAVDVLFPAKTVSKYVNQSVDKEKKSNNEKDDAEMNGVKGVVTRSIEGGKIVETTTYKSLSASPKKVEVQSIPVLTKDYAENLETIQDTYKKKLIIENTEVTINLNQKQQEAKIMQSTGTVTGMLTADQMVFPENITTEKTLPTNISNADDVVINNEDISPEDIDEAFSGLSLGSISISESGIEAWLNYNGGYLLAVEGVKFGPFLIKSVTDKSVVILHSDLMVTKSYSNTIHAVNARTINTAQSVNSDELPPEIDKIR